MKLSRRRNGGSLGALGVGRLRPALIVLVLALLACGGFSVAGDERSGLDPGVRERMEQAAVAVLVDGHLAGTGWRVADGGDVVTAAHVLWKEFERIEVLGHGGERVSASLVGSDPLHDLALLELEEEGPTAAGLELRRGEEVAAGEPLWLLGWPMFRHRILLAGRAATMSPAAEWNPDLQMPTRMLHVSGPAPSGVSGGAWVDHRGRVVGVQSGVVTGGGAPVGLAYMAPVDAVESLLAARGHVVRAELGCAVEELWEQGGGFRDRVPEGVSGVVPRALRDGGAASRAGLSEDHVITEIDGETVGLRDEVLAMLLRSEPGRPLRLSGFDLAEGEDFEIVVELGRVRPPWESQ